MSRNLESTSCRHVPSLHGRWHTTVARPSILYLCTPACHTISPQKSPFRLPAGCLDPCTTAAFRALNLSLHGFLYAMISIVVHFVLRCSGSACTLSFTFSIFRLLLVFSPRCADLVHLRVKISVLCAALAIGFVLQWDTG